MFYYSYIQQLFCNQLKLAQAIKQGGFVGTWVATQNYLPGQTVIEGANVYKALKASLNVTPGTDPTTWQVVGPFTS